MTATRIFISLFAIAVVVVVVVMKIISGTIVAEL